MNRRRLLVAICGLLLLSTGCLSGGIPGDTQSSTLTDSRTSTIAPVTTQGAVTNITECEHGAYRVDAEPVEEVGQLTITYRNQSPAARSVLKTAISPGRWAYCERADGYDDILNRYIQLVRSTDGQTGGRVIWLQYRGKNYCLTIWQQDQLRSACPRTDT